MELNDPGNEFDSSYGAEVTPPANELFAQPHLWPEEIANNPLYTEQVEKRRQTNKQLNEVLELLPRPDITLESAVGDGALAESQVSDLFNSLSGILQDEDYARLALYIPFEFLPDKSWTPKTESLRAAKESFEESYMKAWASLLTTQDVRANFVDGDVLEFYQRTTDLPRVVKAAHLIPKLVEKGLLETPDVIDLAYASPDRVLKESVGEALLVLDDLGFLPDDELFAMRESDDYWLRSMALVIENGRQNPARQDSASRPVSFKSILRSLEAVATDLDAKSFGSLTEKRIAWLKYKRMQDQVIRLAEKVSDSILSDNLSKETVADIVSSDEALAAQVLVEGIQKAIESAWQNDPAAASTLYDKFKKTLQKLWEKGDPAVEATLIKSSRRLYRLGLIDRLQLEEAQITLPVLSGNLSENLNLIPEDMNRIKKITELIESDTELGELVYPAVLVYGSRLKGYGTNDADVDIGVFVKPGTALTEQVRLKSFLNDAIQFWLDEEPGKLKIHDFDDKDPLLGESNWAHVLFGAAWVGDADAVHELRKNLLPGYFYETEAQIYERSTRGLWLEEIERDTLLYRLMHKGYEQHYPAFGGINTAHAGGIDGKSIFWDSGYRQLATKLFVDKVFLPKLPTADKNA